MDENRTGNLSPVSISNIAEAAPPESESKEAGKAEEKDFAAQLLADKTKEELRGLKQDIDERKIYADRSFKLVAYWVGGVFLLLLLQGAFCSKFSIWHCEINWTFKLSDSVLLAVVGGTTVSVIGIFLVVANYLFPKR